MGENFPAARLARSADFFRVDGDDDALGAEFRRRLAHEFRIENSGGIDADFVSARVEHGADIFQLADAAADGERDEYLARHFFHGMHHGVAAFVTGGDVEEGDFIGALFVVAAGDFHRVAGVTDVEEFHAFHDAAVVDIQAGNDAFGQAHFYAPLPARNWSAYFCASRRSRVPS